MGTIPPRWLLNNPIRLFYIIETCKKLAEKPFHLFLAWKFNGRETTFPQMGSFQVSMVKLPG
jgi:hypothetical protein